MKTSLAILCAAALISGAAVAGDDEKRDAGRSSFASLDADSDGKISKDEASGNASLSASFDRLDSTTSRSKPRFSRCAASSAPSGARSK